MARRRRYPPSGPRDVASDAGYTDVLGTVDQALLTRQTPTKEANQPEQQPPTLESSSSIVTSN